MKTSFLRKAVMFMGLVVLICGFAIPAGALTFNFTQNTGFVVNTTDTDLWTYSSGDLLAQEENLWGTANVNRENDIKWFNWGGAPVAPLDGHYNTIAWGVANNQGGLMADDSAWGTDPATVPANNKYSGVQVLGQEGSFGLNEWVTITEVYHQNHAIPASTFTLTDARINSVLQLGIDGQNILPGDFDSIAMYFLETLNQAGACPPGAPALGVDCPDYWEFSIATFAPVDFEYGEVKYQVYFDLVAGDDAVIQYLGNDVIRVWTAENVTSSVSVRMMIVQAQVPEPGILALFGLGLLSLGVAARRRENDE